MTPPTSQAKVPDVVDSAFERQIHRCEITMEAVFHRGGSEAVVLRSWLHQAVPDVTGKTDILHTEPLYLVSMFLGVDESSDEFAVLSESYHNLLKNRSWAP